MRRPRLSIRFMMIAVAAIALILGVLSRRLQQQRDALGRLRNIGGQLEVPALNAMTLFTGITVDNVRFLGPIVGDDQVPVICDASEILGIHRITFMETRLSDRGLRELQAGIPDARIQVITPVPGMDRIR